jgi:ABC-type Fe3+/spermidine/putrescine transport system ATPase subunit
MSDVLIRVAGLKKTFGAVGVLNGIEFSIRQGEVFTLLGPSGCGKSTTLRIIAGLESADEGEITLGNRILLSTAQRINLQPEQRDMGMVFQSYAIWPHMTVAENVAYPLKLRGVARAEIKRRVASALRLVDLEAQADRDAPKLSGGQQQRVALARALVYEPQVLLLDEPLSNLDVKLREQMRLELKLLQERLGLTLIYVTHDQAEALSLSDRVALMNGGRIEQLSPPAELYERPQTEFVRDFLGKTIVLPGRVESRDDAGAMVTLVNAPGRIACRSLNGSTRYLPGHDVNIAIRPERVRMSASRDGNPAALEGLVETVLYQGDRSECAVRVGGELITVYAEPEARNLKSHTVWLDFAPEAVTLWPR